MRFTGVGSSLPNIRGAGMHWNHKHCTKPLVSLVSVSKINGQSELGYAKVLPAAAGIRCDILHPIRMSSICVLGNEGDWQSHRLYSKMPGPGLPFATPNPSLSGLWPFQSS